MQRDTNVRLPVEVWLAVFQECGALAVSLVCCTAAETVRPLTRPALCYAINAACRDGQLELLQWLFSKYQINMSRPYTSQYPFAFAIEQGHLHVLQWLFQNHLDPQELKCMVDSIPRAVFECHFDTVAWIVDTLRKQGCTRLGDKSSGTKLSQLQYCVYTNSWTGLSQCDWWMRKRLNLSRHCIFQLQYKTL